MQLRVAVCETAGYEARREAVLDMVKSCGAEVVEPQDANAIVWLAIQEVDDLLRILDANPAVKWVQLPFAGVERFGPSGVFHRDIQFTCAKGLYGEQVGEHALVLALACLRNLAAQSRSQHWQPMEPESLFRKRVTILGAGGITETLVALLAPFNCDVTVVRRSAEPIKDVRRTVATDQLDAVLPATDVLVLALALTPETINIIGADQLGLLPQGAVVVNVARGQHIDTDALVSALQTGQVAAAGLDVTEPEPLPEGHPLWAMENVIITSHCADSHDFVTEKLNSRIKDNIERLMADRPLAGLVDARGGY